MRGNSSQDLEKEVLYGRLHGEDRGGSPMPRRGDKYVVFGLVGVWWWGQHWGASSAT